MHIRSMSSHPRAALRSLTIGFAAVVAAAALVASPLAANASGVAPESLSGGALGSLPASPAEAGQGDASFLADDGSYFIYRFGGASRYEVAANITADTFDTGVPVLYIASGETFPDALSAGPAAAKQDGGLLLVSHDSIPAATRTTIVGLQPQKLVVVGGVDTISDAVYNELAALQPNILRIAGADRYEVSRNIIDYAFCDIVPGGATDPASCPGGGFADVFVATGGNFPDALAAGPAAARFGSGVLLVNGGATSLDDPTRALLGRVGAEAASIAGGVNSVSQEIENDLRATVSFAARYDGADRFEVAANLNNSFFPPETSTVFIASGAVFPDALSAGPAAAAYGAPLFLVRSDCYPAPTADAIFSTAYDLENLVIMGGTNTIDNGFVTAPRYC
jgi:putative cell wall-binding protein